MNIGIMVAALKGSIVNKVKTNIKARITNNAAAAFKNNTLIYSVLANARETIAPPAQPMVPKVKNIPISVKNSSAPSSGLFAPNTIAISVDQETGKPI